ncbi:MAG: spore maturation protein A [Oscillospiraceae bacterium]|nr:spore maturation protein A [Oscillospiraceae bacterium]MBQ3048352.1 spore maturation protein A [Oscillospiraceae bacterium]MBQ9938641.1 spore maturation protein A [Oscillospiraceae bacterium]
MMSWVLAAMIAAAIIFGCAGGRIDEVSAAAIGDGVRAVELCIELLGAVCLWSGIMKVADKAGLTEKLNKVIHRCVGPLFKGIPRDSAAMKAISLNITSNMLGLGNAATPFGITAMRELDELNGKRCTASAHMILFAVMNSAAFQLVPSASIAAIRLSGGAAAPLDIMPAVWLTSAASLTAGITMAMMLNGILKNSRLPSAKSKKQRRTTAE